MVKQNDIHFTDSQGNEFYLKVSMSDNEILRIDEAFKNKEKIEDVRFYLESDINVNNVEECLIVEYPFQEGDEYYTVEDGDVVRSCWDGVSEEIYDENPSQTYYETYELALKSITNK